MSSVLIEISMSLDGIVAGTNISDDDPLGVGGMRLHDWMFKTPTDIDRQLTENLIKQTGAVVVGGRTYADAIDLENGWDGVNPFHTTAFVVTRDVPAKQVEGFVYVTDGVESAVAQAKEFAGDKDVWVMGGAHLIQACLKAGLIDEIHLHIVPIIFGDGLRLFENLGAARIELERMNTVETAAATHVRYRVVKE